MKSPSPKPSRAQYKAAIKQFDLELSRHGWLDILPTGIRIPAVPLIYVPAAEYDAIEANLLKNGFRLANSTINEYYPPKDKWLRALVKIN